MYYVRQFDDQNLIVHAGMGLPPVEYGQVITMIYLKVAIYASPRLPSPLLALSFHFASSSVCLYVFHVHTQTLTNAGSFLTCKCVRGRLSKCM